MKFSFKLGVYLVLATTMAMLITLGGAYQLSVTEQLDRATEDAHSQRVLAKLEELVNAREAMEAATIAYIVGESENELRHLNESEAASRRHIVQLVELVARNPAQRQRGLALQQAAADTAEQLLQIRRVREERGIAAAVAYISQASYRKIEKEFENLVEVMRKHEHDLVDANHAHHALRMQQLGRLTLWSGLLTLALALFAGAVIHRQRKERRAAEASLRERERQYRIVTGSVPAMICYVDSTHRVRSHNQAVEQWLELPTERIDHHHLAEVLGVATYNSILPEIEAVLKGQRTQYERTRIAGDGSEHFLAGTFIPDFDANETVVGFFVMIIDITERKTAEQALRQSEERWKFALEGAGDGVWDLNVLTGEVLYSRRYKEMLGYADDEFGTRREAWEQRIHHEDKARVSASLQDYLAGRSEAYNCEFRMQCKDGSWIWILARGVVVSRDTSGRPLRMIGTHSDVSARVSQQEEIARVNERLDLALQGSRLAIWDADIASGAIYLSEGWSEILGEERKETITNGTALLDRVHPQDRALVYARFLAALKGASPEYHVEHRVRTHDGEWKWILSHGQVVSRDSAGHALRMTGTNADISARKEIERMKNEFVSVVSHELRTPLSSIVGALALLIQKSDWSEENGTLIRVARDNSQRLVRLVNDILDLEKLDSSAMQIQREPVELGKLLATAVQANLAYSDQFGVKLVLEPATEPLWVEANSDRLIQVVTNLISNAAKFSRRGASVYLRLQRKDQAIRVSVEDSGSGIPDSFRARVFDRFAQADSSTSRLRGGTGLGLAICKMIIDKLGGSIGFDTAIGKGSTFYFELPALERAATVAAASAARG